MERPEDEPQVRAVNEQAFEHPIEADLVDRLRRACPGALSLVAEDGGLIVGHIFFTPVVVGDPEQDVQGMGLAPMAVDPNRWRQGIGSALVERGLEMLRERGCPFVVVLGHPGYYPRFGFVPASGYNLTCQWDGVPDEAFMAIVFDEDALRGVSGVARYRDEFDEAM
jgi:putative acetyltransferase